MRYLCVFVLLATLPARAEENSSARKLKGVVSGGGGMAHARVIVVDKTGKRWSTLTDDMGNYQIELPAPVPPLLISTHEAGNDNCLRVDRPRSRCMASLLATLPEQGDAIANVNPLTDLLVSNVAVEMSLLGPQQLVEKGTTADVPADSLANQLSEWREEWKPVLVQVQGIRPNTFDPVSTVLSADRTGIDGLFDLLHHNRNADNNTGHSSETVLTDIAFRPLYVKEEAMFEPIQLRQAEKERKEIVDAKVRVFIVGDSTAATYEKGRYPLMGWGQVFEESFKPAARVKVQNGARPGRSSRDFYTGGWYRQVARFLQKGDYVLIQLGHNDEKCDGKKPVRGPADLAMVCTYPNDEKGRRQFPSGRPELSFQSNLERYIYLARGVGAIPVLLTPTARVLNEKLMPGVPAIPAHVTRKEKGKEFAFVGDYAQTVRDTAKANHVPLIDLEEASRAFVNEIGDPAWKDYYMVVDPNRYPYYAWHPSGTPQKPDTTHFQEKGARAMADLVRKGIKATPELTRLASLLK